jgi:hypothetical protein
MNAQINVIEVTRKKACWRQIHAGDTCELIKAINVPLEVAEAASGCVKVRTI